MIRVSKLSKQYKVSKKVSGLRATLKHFFKREYKTVEAVKELDFTIEDGEFVGFLGANGAGKTTTLKMLTGLIHPSSGSIDINGFFPFDRKAEFLHDITLVMGQKQQLIWDLPALDSLRINASVYGLSAKELEERTAELSEMLDLREQLSQPVRKLSLGQRMKAELMAALLHRPRLLFLDEPTLGLDINAQVAVRGFLEDYNQRYKATIILTSHYMADITALCERVLIIHEGQLVHDGGLTQLLEKAAPHRQVELDLVEPMSNEQAESFGEVKENSGRKLRLAVKREDLTAVVSRLLSEVEVSDLEITDPPIEEIIGQVFQEGVVR